MHRISSSESYSFLFYDFKVEDFSTKVVLNKDILSTKYDTSE